MTASLRASNVPAFWRERTLSAICFTAGVPGPFVLNASPVAVGLVSFNVSIFPDIAKSFRR